jgi:hypothetical protein
MTAKVVPHRPLATSCVRKFTVSHADDLEQYVLKQLETSGATRQMMTLRMLMLQRAVLAIGTFSLLKPAPDQMRAKPFDELDRYLSKHGRTQLASDFTDYNTARAGATPNSWLARLLWTSSPSAGDLFAKRVTSPKSIS